jgi:hypothetical protein
LTPGAFFQCGNCGAALGETGWYRRRVPRKGGKKLPVCGSCASTIDKQEPLIFDEESDHADKPRRERLRKETRGSRGDKEQVCPDCGASFRWPGELANHRFVVHGTVDEAAA